MSREYQKQVLLRGLSQILIAEGFTTCTTQCLDLLSALMDKYIEKLTQTAATYAQHQFPDFNMPITIASLKLAMQAMKPSFTMEDLYEFLRAKKMPAPFPHPVPKYPIAAESNLNFLDSASHEASVRPEHIPLHLPSLSLLDLKEQETPTCLWMSIKNSDDQETLTITELESSSVEPEQPKKEQFVGGANFTSDSSSSNEWGPPDGYSDSDRQLSTVEMRSEGVVSLSRQGRVPQSLVPVLTDHSLYLEATYPVGSSQEQDEDNWRKDSSTYIREMMDSKGADVAGQCKLSRGGDADWPAGNAKEKKRKREPKPDCFCSKAVKLEVSDDVAKVNEDKRKKKKKKKEKKEKKDKKEKRAAEPNGPIPRLILRKELSPNGENQAVFSWKVYSGGRDEQAPKKRGPALESAIEMPPPTPQPRHASKRNDA